MKRVIVFAHYAADRRIHADVLYYLRALIALGGQLVVVSTAALIAAEAAKIEQLGAQLIERENVGHDFSSYQAGIASIANWSEIEQLILCNDSCLGPLFSLDAIFAQMAARNYDFWGISSLARPAPHLQSYFLVFNPPVFNSGLFKNFWQQLRVLADKDQIVFNYEVGLSQILIQANFSWGSFIPAEGFRISYTELLCRKALIYSRECHYSTSRYSWKTLFEPLARVDKTLSLYDYSLRRYQLPLLKKSLFRDNWLTPTEIVRQVAQVSDYPSDLFHEVLVQP